MMAEMLAVRRDGPSAERHEEKKAFLVSPGEERMLLRLRQLPAGEYFTLITVAGDDLRGLVLLNEKPCKRQRLRD
jgi:hypothetical protein